MMPDVTPELEGVVDASSSARLAESNIGAALAVWARAAEGGGIEQVVGGLMARAAAPLRSFNQVLLTDGRAASGLAEVAASAERFIGKGRRFRVRILEGVAPEDDAAFAAVGLERHGGLPSMALELPAGASKVSDGVEIREVTDEAMLAAHAGIVALAFGWEPADLAWVLRPGLIGAEGWHAFTAYVDGVAAASAQVVIDGACGGLYYIATSDEQRRRGLGEAVTRHAASVAASAGCTIATLQASPMGQPVYERIGFRRAGFYRTYIPAGTA